MRTAIDANVISALWSGEPAASHVERPLQDARREGSLVICGPVYAELLAYPKSSEAYTDRFLSDVGISVDFEVAEATWREAGRRFARYAERRRRSGGGGAKRMLTDFVIGAHALQVADRLLTLDADRYRRDFPELRLL